MRFHITISLKIPPLVVLANGTEKMDVSCQFHALVVPDVERVLELAPKFRRFDGLGFGTGSRLHPRKRKSVHETIDLLTARKVVDAVEGEQGEAEGR